MVFSGKLFILLLLTFLGAGCKNLHSLKSAEPKPVTNVTAAEPKPVTNVLTAREAVVGIWTGKTFCGNYLVWYKIDVSQHLTATVYTARAIDRGWGNPIPQSNERMDSAKYIDTGERYYFLRLSAIPMWGPDGWEDETGQTSRPTGWLIPHNEKSAVIFAVYLNSDELTEHFNLQVVKRDTFPFTP